jgi:hypothetical protein
LIIASASVERFWGLSTGHPQAALLDGWQILPSALRRQNLPPNRTAHDPLSLSPSESASRFEVVAGRYIRLFERSGPKRVEIEPNFPLNYFSPALMLLIWTEYRARLAGYFDDEKQGSLGGSNLPRSANESLSQAIPHWND